MTSFQYGVAQQQNPHTPKHCRSVKGQLYTWGKGAATGFDVGEVIPTPRQATRGVSDQREVRRNCSLCLSLSLSALLSLSVSCFVFLSTYT